MSRMVNSLNVLQNQAVKLTGPDDFFMGIFLNIDSISLIITRLFRYSIVSQFSFVSYTFVRIYPFYLFFQTQCLKLFIIFFCYHLNFFQIYSYVLFFIINIFSFFSLSPPRPFSFSTASLVFPFYKFFFFLFQKINFGVYLYSLV